MAEISVASDSLSVKYKLNSAKLVFILIDATDSFGFRYYIEH